MTLWIDRFINLCKWPTAFFAICLLPFLFETLPKIFLQTIHVDFLPFWGGLVGYFLLWRLFFRYSGSFLPTLEHELTHVIFAIGTGHRIVDFKVRWNSGGHVAYTGGVGNWLITISPYIFPLLLLLALPSVLMWVAEPELRGGLLGVIFAFELISTWRQIHTKQPDLIKVGWFFCFLFLPPALLTVYGSVLYFLITDISSLLVWYREGIYSIYELLVEVKNGYYSH